MNSDGSPLLDGMSNGWRQYPDGKVDPRVYLPRNQACCNARRAALRYSLPMLSLPADDPELHCERISGRRRAKRRKVASDLDEEQCREELERPVSRTAEERPMRGSGEEGNSMIYKQQSQEHK